MTRRVFLRDLVRAGGSMAGFGLLAGCVPPPAATPSRVYRVGMLSGTSALSQPDELARPYFWQRLGELGYVEGQNLVREIRQQEGEDNAQFAVFAADLVSLQVDVIVAATGPGIQAAVAATSSIPIVMLEAFLDPVAEGFADSPARPGRNLTGTMGGPREVQQKLLQLLVEAAPGVSKVAVLAAGPAVPDDFWESAARSLGVDLLTLRATSRDDLDSALDRIVAEGADSLLVQTGSTTRRNADLILSFAERRRLPAVYPSRPWVTRGGLMTYQAVGQEIQRRTADFVDRILRGVRPADLPIENPTRYELVVNMTTARAMGLTFPPSFSVQVDEVIE